MNLIEILGILGIHWFADFVCQTDSQANGKSKNWSSLLSHTIIYSLIWIPFIFILYSVSHNNLAAPTSLILFMPITFICHTITDYYTSKTHSQLWQEKKVHGFFVSIGFDQYLHYIQLFLTYWYLIN